MTKCGIAVVCMWISAAFAAATAAGPIRVTSYRQGEAIRFPVPLICGTLADAKITSVTVVNSSSKRDTRELEGLAHKGRFKALTDLVPGSNKLVIRAGKDELPLTLTYKPQTNPYVVRIVYFTDSTGNTDFQTPIPDDPQNWRGKLDTAMKLMQTFTAERLGDLGLGRTTFNLELDDDGKVKVHLLKGPKNVTAYHKLTGGQLYGEIGRELARRLRHRQARNLVIPAFTRFDPKLRKVYAHTALGGGNLALFGGGDLFTWPDGLAEVQKAFMNATPVDPKKWFSDSVGRHTFWAIASTTMGAALHELGHTFGLPHSRDAHDIMTRGHDRLNRFFTLIEPPHARR
ncbi:MAG: metallopeptidase, partial [Phycisphaerae bacterium]